MHDWLEHLASGKGLCCSFADGYMVEDADREAKGGYDRVRVPVAADAIWLDVIDDAVIAESNKAGEPRRSRFTAPWARVNSNASCPVA